MSRVLIVDDHAILRGGLVSLLSTTDDLEVVGEAESGEEAVRLADELEPDVVLMDLSMPGMNGVEATALIRAQDPSISILVLTSLADRNWIMEAVEAGADGYLLKHAEPEVILAGIREVLRGGSPLDPRAARAVLSSRQAEPPSVVLSAREEEVLRMVTQGLPNKSIARRLGISERTVKAHLTHIFQRLGVTDRTQAALWATRRAAERGREY
jgi:DNA-binding NarL/FixJ family response regulator